MVRVLLIWDFFGHLMQLLGSEKIPISNISAGIIYKYYKLNVIILNYP